MVWLIPGGESARVSRNIILTYVIGLGGLNHIIAGYDHLFPRVLSAHASWEHRWRHSSGGGPGACPGCWRQRGYLAFARERTILTTQQDGDPDVQPAKTCVSPSFWRIRRLGLPLLA